jgi:hypothetical protein
MFDAAVHDELHSAQEVRIRTSRRSDRGVTLWIVVAGEMVFVRSFRGPRAIWFSGAMADGQASLEIGGRLVEVRVTPVADPATIAAVSQAFLSKYVDSPYAQAMVAPEILSTTLRLSPIQRDGTLDVNHA